MYDYHYNTTKKQFRDKAKLLLTDNNSLCYEIETDDLYDDTYRNKKLYDSRDYKDDHLFYINNNLTGDKSNKILLKIFNKKPKAFQ